MTVKIVVGALLLAGSVLLFVGPALQGREAVRTVENLRATAAIVGGATPLILKFIASGGEETETGNFSYLGFWAFRLLVAVFAAMYRRFNPRSVWGLPYDNIMKLPAKTPEPQEQTPPLSSEEQAAADAAADAALRNARNWFLLASGSLLVVIGSAVDLWHTIATGSS
jgi:hypothetical protein